MKRKLIRFYGSPLCPDCLRSRKYLDSKKISYQYIDLETDEKAAEEVRKINNGFQSIPTIVFPDGKILVEPTEKILEAYIKRFSGEKN